MSTAELPSRDGAFALANSSRFKRQPCRISLAVGFHLGAPCEPHSTSANVSLGSLRANSPLTAKVPARRLEIDELRPAPHRKSTPIVSPGLVVHSVGLCRLPINALAAEIVPGGNPSERSMPRIATTRHQRHTQRLRKPVHLEHLPKDCLRNAGKRQRLRPPPFTPYTSLRRYITHKEQGLTDPSVYLPSQASQ